MQEEWRPVVGFEGLYEVSEYGVVRSLPRVTRIKNGHTRVLSSRIIKTYRNARTGHESVNLVPREGVARIKKCRVHCVVLEAFVGPRPDGYFGCHNDGDVYNNHFSNLRWDTPSGNNYDRVKHGKHPYANRSHCKRGHPLDGVWTWPNGAFKQRYCKMCARDRARRQHQRLSAEQAA